MWEDFYLRKLSELEVRKQYQIEISNRFVAMENLNDREDMLGRALKRMSQPQLKRGLVCMNCSSISNGLMKNVYAS
jgi:hypothetical protein